MDDARAERAGEAPGLFAEGLPVAPAPGVVRGAAAPAGYLGHRARLRRRLLDGGPAALRDHELLEMVLFLALPRRDTKPIAHALLRRFGGFAQAVGAPPRELDAVPGLGESGVAALKAVEAVAQRLAGAAATERPILDSRERVAGYLGASLGREREEQVRVLFLDGHDQLITDEAQARGATKQPPISPREVVRRALEVGAVALILVRSRPEGDGTPSRADVEMAAAVKTAASSFGIALHDHLIMERGRHTSLKGEGLL